LRDLVDGGIAHCQPNEGVNVPERFQFLLAQRFGHLHAQLAQAEHSKKSRVYVSHRAKERLAQERVRCGLLRVKEVTNADRDRAPLSWNLETMMKALCWHGKGDIRCDNVPDPEIEHGRDAIIKMTACAICGSDLHLMDGYIPSWRRETCLATNSRAKSLKSVPTTRS
jgi:hypothetical protein